MNRLLSSCILVALLVGNHLIQANCVTSCATVGCIRGWGLTSGAEYDPLIAIYVRNGGPQPGEPVGSVTYQLRPATYLEACPAVITPEAMVPGAGGCTSNEDWSDSSTLRHEECEVTEA